MNTKVRNVGLDVHAESIVVGVADAGQEPAEVLKTIPYDEPRLLQELKRLGPLAHLKVCYEAGPTGFGWQRFLQTHGVDCVVIAPSMVPVQCGSRIKTDRRDARRLAHFLRSGDLTPIWVPDEQTEALRDLERSREDARLAERRARQQLLKFLLRHGRRFTEGKHNWTQTHWRWVLRQRFSLEALSRVLAGFLWAAALASLPEAEAGARIQQASVLPRPGGRSPLSVSNESLVDTRTPNEERLVDDAERTGAERGNPRLRLEHNFGCTLDRRLRTAPDGDLICGNQPAHLRVIHRRQPAPPLRIPTGIPRP